MGMLQDLRTQIPEKFIIMLVVKELQLLSAATTALKTYFLFFQISIPSMYTPATFGGGGFFPL